MKHVDIFITHNMTNMKAKWAAYVYVICAETPKGDATYTGFGTENDVTVNRVNLLAVESALKHFHSSAEITIYTDSSTIAGAFNCNNIKTWEANGFHTARGKPLANVDLWYKVSELTQKHLVNAVMTRQHQFKNWAKDELNKKYGKTQ